MEMGKLFSCNVDVLLQLRFDKAKRSKYSKETIADKSPWIKMGELKEYLKKDLCIFYIFLLNSIVV